MHRNAPLTPEGRLRLCLMIDEGWTIASSAESMRISRPRPSPVSGGAVGLGPCFSPSRSGSAVAGVPPVNEGHREES